MIDVNQKYESAELKDLFLALCNAQNELSVSPQKTTNTFFKSKYSDLQTIVKSSRACLCKNGLSIIQRIIPSETDKSSLCTRLCHNSGQWIESVVPINPPKSDIQTYGSYITYLRRYSYAAIVGVITSDDIDDDGECAMQDARRKDWEPRITRDQLEILSNELNEYDDILKLILDGFKINKLSDVESRYFNQTLIFINKQKEFKLIKKEKQLWEGCE